MSENVKIMGLETARWTLELAWVLAFLATCFGLSGVLGYWTGEESLATWGPTMAKMALPTALGLSCLGSAVMILAQAAIKTAAKKADQLLSRGTC